MRFLTEATYVTCRLVSQALIQVDAFMNAS